MKNFFIIGAPKTGTTLLARLIDSHPEIACTTELFPFHMKGGRRKLNPNWKGKLQDHGFDELIEPMQKVLSKNLNNNESVHTIMLSILTNFGIRNRVKIVGDKFPWYIGFIDDMLEMFPDAHYIYNVRDPRAVWNSAKHFTHVKRADSLLKLMLGYDKKIEPYLERDNFLQLGFENLVEFPKINKTLFATYFGVKDKWTDDEPLYPARFKGIPNSTKPLDPSIIDKWKTQMTKQEIKRVTNMSIDFIKKYGYGESA